MLTSVLRGPARHFGVLRIRGVHTCARMCVRVPLLWGNAVLSRKARMGRRVGWHTGGRLRLHRRVRRLEKVPLRSRPPPPEPLSGRRLGAFRTRAAAPLHRAPLEALALGISGGGCSLLRLAPAPPIPPAARFGVRCGQCVCVRLLRLPGQAHVPSTTSKDTHVDPWHGARRCRTERSARAARR